MVDGSEQMPWRRQLEVRERGNTDECEIARVAILKGVCRMLEMIMFTWACSMLTMNIKGRGNGKDMKKTSVPSDSLWELHFVVCQAAFCFRDPDSST